MSRTPEMFSAATRSALLSSSDPTVPQKCTTPSETMTFNSVRCTHFCLRSSVSNRSRIKRSLSSLALAAPPLANTCSRSARDIVDQDVDMVEVLLRTIDRGDGPGKRFQIGDNGDCFGAGGFGLVPNLLD